jgi:carbamoyl-phosphate synthase small subunit
MRHVKLILADGTTMVGQSVGPAEAVGGEVVFNTAMSGYVETLTDPSYHGQILVCTYPLIGNYGVPAPRVPGSIELPYESDRIQVQGLVMQNYVDDYSHHAAARSLAQWLHDDGVPGVTGIDTRTLTRRLREHGTIAGWLVPEGVDEDQARSRARSVDMRREVFERVRPTRLERYGETGPTILLIDIGAKDNIVRSLLQRGCTVLRAPWNEDLSGLAADCDGIMLSNGPGDPADLPELVAALRGLIADFDRPIFGICLGNQLLGLAAGAATYKLPYGHRGINQPVRDLHTGRCFITSQNHGYAIDNDSLPAGWEVWFVNLNDGTNEGIRAVDRAIFSVQFHPEAHPGCRDTGYLFDDFLDEVRRRARAA